MSGNFKKSFYYIHFILENREVRKRLPKLRKLVSEIDEFEQ